MSTESSIKLAEAIPGAKVEILPRAGHLLFIERSGEFNELTLGFLDYLSEKEDKFSKQEPVKLGMLKKLLPLSKQG